MRQKDLINRIAGEIEEITILDVEAEDPFGWDLSKDHVWEPKKMAPKKKRPYDPLKDSRISDLLRPCGDPPKLRRFLMERISMSIVAGLCTCDLKEPDDAQMADMLVAAGTTAKEMNAFARWHPDMPLSCFSRSSLMSVGILLYKVLWDLLCTECGDVCWTADDKDDGRRSSVDRERARLKTVAEYLQRNSLLMFSGTGGKDDEERRQEAQTAYENFFVRFTVLSCKRRIAASELHAARDRKEKERSRLLQYNKKVMARELRHKKGRYAVRAFSAPQVAALVNAVPEAAMKGSGPVKIGNRPETEDFLSAGIAEKLWQLAEGKNTGEAAHLLAVECAIHPLPPALQTSMSRVERNLIALEEYVDAVEAKCLETLDEVAVREAQEMRVEDALAVAEGAFLAILDGDEVSRLTVGYLLFAALGHLFSLPGFGCEAPELEDREQWKQEECPEDNRDLVLPVIQDDEFYTVRSRKTGPWVGILYPVKLNAVIAQYAGCRFDKGIFVRKSMIRAFREMGISQRKARECAIVVAVVEAMFAREELSARNYFKESLPEAEDPAAGEAAANFEKVSARLEEALRAKKNGERENQRLRHELAGLNRKLGRLQSEIDRRDELIGLYERLDEEGEAGEEGTQEESAASGESCVEFPFYTDRKVVLYGGFHSFHQDIEKRLPGIRIIPYAAHLDLAPFRNADVIFIQINKTNHSNYWNVCDTARTMGIPFYHLNYANPGRCAAEMVNKIRELEKAGR